MSTPQVTIIDPRKGDVSGIVECWRRLQKQNSTLQSPYFSPAFTQIVAAARTDVEVAVLHEAGEVVAIFPFERRQFGIAGPVGSVISDCHGAISRAGYAFEPLDLLRNCGLVAWDFYHVPSSQRSFASFFQETHRSPILDLSAGYDVYIRERREAGTEQIKKNTNLMRRLDREIGPLRFVAHSADKALLDQLMQWKTNQFRQNRWRDLFSIPWVHNAIEGIHAAQTPDFAGMLSALYAGDRLVALHFGMRSATVWHYWFPAYDPAYAKYSPGVMLLLRIAEVAPSLGIKTIDLGCGEHSYKSRLMNGFVTTAEGTTELPCLTTTTRCFMKSVFALRSKTRRWLGTTPIGNVARRTRAALFHSQ